MTKPKPRGYVDNQCLARAQRANRRIVGHVQRIVDQGDRMSVQRLLNTLTRIALDLADQSDALAEMERIRR